MLKTKEFKSEEEKLGFLMLIKNSVIQLITLEFFNKFSEEALDVLRHFFCFYADHEELLVEGIKFFSLFPEIIKSQKFNSLKAFLFYFAYQTKRYNFPLVKVLFEQELIKINIVDPKIYLEFCMYCFYMGLYHIEKKDFFLASYLYCISVRMGFDNNYDDVKIFNQFSLQMIRSLCFLKSLTSFDIKNYLFRDIRISYFSNNSNFIRYENIDELFNYIRNEKDDLKSLKDLEKTNKNMIHEFKLQGLKNEAEEAIIFRTIKDILSIYKKIKMSKLAQKTQIEFDDIVKVLKKKVMSGEINIKYDVSTDVVEVFDIDPGLKERVERIKNLYAKVVEANKNLFINLKDKKMNQMMAVKYSKEERELLNNKHYHEDYEHYPDVEMDMDLDDD